MPGPFGREERGIGAFGCGHGFRRSDVDETGKLVRGFKAEFGEKTIDWLAYPYGLNSIPAQQAVRDASYVGALLISGGWHRPHEVSKFARPRFSVPARFSVAGLKARLLGALPT